MGCHGTEAAGQGAGLLLPTSPLPSPDPRPFPATFEGEFGKGLRLHEAGDWCQGILLGEEGDAPKCGKLPWLRGTCHETLGNARHLSEPQFPGLWQAPSHPSVVRVTSRGCCVPRPGPGPNLARTADEQTFFPFLSLLSSFWGARNQGSGAPCTCAWLT